MSGLDQCDEPGILLVLAKPTSSQHLSDFHNWYDTEHGPARLKLGKGYFSNGYRYKSRNEDSIWLAVYEMDRLSAGADPAYTTLRENRSLREQDMFEHKLSVVSRQFLQLQAMKGCSAKPSVRICIVNFCVESDAAQDVGTWYSKVSTRTSNA